MNMLIMELLVMLIQMLVSFYIKITIYDLAPYKQAFFITILDNTF